VSNTQTEEDLTMSGWTSEQLAAVGDAVELRIAGRRADGTLRKPTIIWAVRTGDDVFARSVNGPTATWFRGVEKTAEARIWAGGVEADVDVIRAEDEEDAIDAAYWAKYGRYAGPTQSITSSLARSTTLKLVPKS
jgi:hypothetical protein